MKYYVIAKRYDVLSGKIENKTQAITEDIANAFIFRDAYNEFFKKALTPDTKAFVMSERDLLNN